MITEREAVYADISRIPAAMRKGEVDAALENAYASADAYARAERLLGHVEACGLRNGGPHGFQRCGDGWYCDKAPIQVVQGIAV